uniref:Uncharacterized protein TCIL3000_10_14010 n=1 Tax=Trypanosoma congolense (strain IL3000) TaxID=1068625 RepID=G0UYZ7_TRYCI|nr:unnamed protein product [Trypanosoma congolense IL3000]
MSFDISRFLPKGTATVPTLLSSHGCFICGPRSCGKTSFAFQAVVNTVQDGGRVVVLCQEFVLYAKMPRPFTPLEQLGEELLSRIEFAYLTSTADVVRELGRWIELGDVPALVLIDDDSFSDAGDVRHTALMLSMLENVYAWVERNGGIFHYLFVSSSYPVSSVRENLPLGAFPLAWFNFTSGGTVYVAAKGLAPSAARPLVLEWREGLVLRSVWGFQI